jgi:tRNA dimethylallyltransferase
MILILGVTASGKASLAFKLAKQINAEIISIDSMKVYRRMDLGTAKPSPEHRRQVNYHLIDVVEPSESFSVAAFLELTDQAIEKIRSKNKTVIAVGGTALYIKAMLFGLFEGPGSDNNIRDQLKQKARDQGIDILYKQLQQIDPEAAQRIQAESKRMNARVKKMIEAGLVDEVRSLLAEEKPMSEQARCAIGYAEIIDHLNGNTTLDETIELIKKNTRKLAKSQRTWFKTFKNVNWLDLQPDESPEQIFEKAKNLIGSI